MEYSWLTGHRCQWADTFYNWKYSPHQGLNLKIALSLFVFLIFGEVQTASRGLLPSPRFHWTPVWGQGGDVSPMTAGRADCYSTNVLEFYSHKKISYHFSSICSSYQITLPKPSLHSCCYLSVTNHSWHFSRPTLPCLHALVHLCSAWSWALDGWLQVFVHFHELCLLQVLPNLV